MSRLGLACFWASPLSFGRQHIARLSDGQIAKPTASRHATVCSAEKSRQTTGPRPNKADNYYDLLGVPTDADGSSIKARYRQLQKEYHPDTSGDEFVELSADLNEAFSVLKDQRKRSQYDRKLRAENGGRMPGAGELKRSDTLVGPIRHGHMLMRSWIEHTDEESSVGGSENEGPLVVWLREWSRTLAFAAGIPLPLPVQADDVPRGTRLSFISVSNGMVQTVGALDFSVERSVPESNSQGDDIQSILQPSSPWEVQVQRVSFGETRSGALATSEQRVLKAFSAALRGRTKQKDNGGSGIWGLSGIAAAVTQGFIGGIPMFVDTDFEGAGLEAYHLKHGPQDGRSPPVKEEQEQA